MVQVTIFAFAKMTLSKQHNLDRQCDSIFDYVIKQLLFIKHLM